MLTPERRVLRARAAANARWNPDRTDLRDIDQAALAAARADAAIRAIAKWAETIAATLPAYTAEEAAAAGRLAAAIDRRLAAEPPTVDDAA